MNMSRDPNTTSPLGAMEGEETMKLPIKNHVNEDEQQKQQQQHQQQQQK